MAGSSGNKTNSAFNWVEVEVEAELGNKLAPFLTTDADTVFGKF